MDKKITGTKSALIPTNSESTRSSTSTVPSADLFEHSSAKLGSREIPLLAPPPKKAKATPVAYRDLVLPPPPLSVPSRVTLVAEHTAEGVLALHSDLLQHYENVAFLSSIDSLDTLLGDTVVAVDGRMMHLPGPLEMVLEKGGVLLIDAREFASHELESLNTLMTDPPRFRGDPVNSALQIIVVMSLHSIATEQFATSFISRVDAIGEVSLSTPLIAQISTVNESNVAVVAGFMHLHLEGESDAAGKLFGQTRPDEHGEFINVEGLLAQAIRDKQEGVVLHNAPWSDLSFAAKLEEVLVRNGFMHYGQWVSLGDLQIVRVDNYSAEERSEAKQRVTLVELHESDASPLIINSGNFSQLFERSIVGDHKLQMHEGLIGHFRTLRIVGDLLSWQWDKLFTCGAHLSLSIDPHVRRPARWIHEDHASMAVLHSGDEYHIEELPQEVAPCTTIVRARDASLTVNQVCKLVGPCEVIHVAAETSSADLLENVAVSYLTDDTIPYVEHTTRHMMELLTSGHTVVLRGLAHNPDLRESLATLIYGTPPYALINGEILQVTGRLVIIDEQVRGAWTISNKEVVFNAYAQATLDDYFGALHDEFGWLDKESLARILEVFDLFPKLHCDFEALRKILRLCRPLGEELSPRAWQRAIVTALGAAFEDDSAKYAEFKARVQQLYQGTVRETIHTQARSPEEQWQRRIEKCVAILRNNPALFLQGPPGAGKSYITAQIAQLLAESPFAFGCETFGPLNIGPHTRLHELVGDGSGGIVATWATSTRPGLKVLVIDEANLTQDGFWEFLRGMFDSSRTIMLNGANITLSDEHIIIFTGNSDRFPGRSTQTLVREAFVTMVFPEQTPEFLATQIIQPSLAFLGEAAGDYDSGATFILGELHAQAKVLMPDVAFSPRDIFECAARIQARDSYDEDLRQLIVSVWSEVYLGRLPLEQRPAVEHWLLQRFGVTFYSPPSVIESTALIMTPSVEYYAQRLDATLAMHQQRRYTQAPNAKGKFGMLIEGPAGRGKDDVLIAALQARGYEKYQNETEYDDNTYCILNGGGSLAEIRKHIDRARLLGGIIVLQELNLLPSDVLEGLLNNAVDGGAHPAFFLFATINPDNFPGRSILSQAFLNRVVCEHLDDYPRHELYEIVQRAGRLSAEDAEYIVDVHCKISDALKRAGKYTKPTPREALRVAHRVGDGEAVDVVFENVYHKYDLIIGDRKDETGSADVQVRNSADATLQTLARLISHDPKLRVIANTRFQSGGLCLFEDHVVIVAANSDPEIMSEQVQMLAAYFRYSIFSNPTAPWQLTLENARVRECWRASQIASYVTLEATDLLEQLSEKDRELLIHKCGSRKDCLLTLQAFLSCVPQWNDNEARIKHCAIQAQEYLVVLAGLKQDLPALQKPATAARVVREEKIATAIGSAEKARTPQELAPPMLSEMNACRTAGSMRIDHPEPNIYCPYRYIESIDEMGRQMVVDARHALPTAQMPLRVCGTVEFDSPLAEYILDRLYYAVPLPYGTAIGRFETVPAITGATMTQNADGRLLLDTGGKTIDRLSYQLLVAETIASESPAALFAPDYFSCNALERWPELHNCFTSIVEREDALENKLRAMCTLFKNGCLYDSSPQCAERFVRAREQTVNVAEQLLITRSGVCRHFAHAFAGLVHEYLRIPVRVVEGCLAQNRKISQVAHAWVEVFIEGKRWLVLDPTTSSIEAQTQEAIAAVAPEHLESKRESNDLEQREAWALEALLIDASESDTRGTIELGSAGVELSREARESPERILTRLQNAHPDWFINQASMRLRYSSTPGGMLDIQRLMARKTDIFAHTVCGTEKIPKQIVIKPELLHGAYWADEIHALIVSGAQVRVSMPDGREAIAQDITQVQWAIVNTNPSISRRHEPKYTQSTVLYTPTSAEHRILGEIEAELRKLVDQLGDSEEPVQYTRSDTSVASVLDVSFQDNLIRIALPRNTYRQGLHLSKWDESEADAVNIFLSLMEKFGPEQIWLSVSDEDESHDLQHSSIAISISGLTTTEYLELSCFGSVSIADCPNVKTVEVHRVAKIEWDIGTMGLIPTFSRAVSLSGDCSVTLVCGPERWDKCQAYLSHTVPAEGIRLDLRLRDDSLPN